MNAKTVTKTISRTCCWTLMISVAVYCGYAYGWPWAIAGFVGTWLAVLLLIVVGGIAYAAAAMYLPVPNWFARPLYLHWKNQLKARHKESPIHPLVDFPLVMYIELQLDKEFEKGGWSGATAALDKWLEEAPERTTNAIQAIIDAKRGNSNAEIASVSGGREDQGPG